MKLKAVAAAIVAVVTVPIALQGAEGQTPPSEKRYCEVNKTTGSRLGAVRTCRTKAERDAAKAENRSVVDRIQTRRSVTEDMYNTYGGARNMCRSLPRGC